MSGGTVRVDYAGPGGACEGMRWLGLEPVGIEWDDAACATRAAAGHLTIRADLATYRTPAEVWGYWASPPCQTFSTAGKGDGRALLPELAAAIRAKDWSAADRFDDRTRHVIDAARVAATCGAEWVAMEQVPPVLPVFQAVAWMLERRGYSTWCGVLCAADYGVPQTRRRAFLMASRSRRVGPPVPTHAETPGLWGELPWVSMATALGWGFDNEPSATVSGGGASTGGAEPFANIAGAKGQWLIRRERSGDRAAETFGAAGPSQTLTSKARSWEVTGWPWTAPATTVAGDPRISARCHHEQGTQGANAIDASDVATGTDPEDRPIRLTTRDALILQSFAADYPVQGSRSAQFMQIGNAVPPLLAMHVASAASGIPVRLEAAS